MLIAIVAFIFYAATRQRTSGRKEALIAFAWPFLSLVTGNALMIVIVVTRSGGWEKYLWLTIYLNLGCLISSLFLSHKWLRNFFVSSVTLQEVRLPLVGAAVPGVTVAHLSDLHLTGWSTVEGGLRAQNVTSRVLSIYNDACNNSEFVVITGDITDLGRGSEWDLFMKFANREIEAGRLFLVPGNHDLSFCWSSFRHPGKISYDFELKCGRFVNAVLSKAPTSWKCSVSGQLISISEVLNASRRYIEASLKWYEEQSRFQMLADRVPQRALYKNSREYFDDSLVWPTKKFHTFSDIVSIAYPMIFADTNDVIIIGLNSNTIHSNSILFGAFGALGARQLRELDNILRKKRNRPAIILIHHHIGFPPSVYERLSKLYSSIEIKSLQLADAKSLKRIVLKYPGCIVLHGHKHISYTAALGHSKIISAPSVTYGDILGGGRSWHSYLINYQSCELNLYLRNF
jgi:3',5'-cyclic AMP phosphodiesterase CpdA